MVSGLIDPVAREAGAPVDGNAGMALFVDGRLVIDYPGRRLWLQPPRSCRADRPLWRAPR